MSRMLVTPLRRWAAALGATVVVSMTAMTAMTATAAASATWPTYHNTPNRQGVDPSEPSLAPAHQAWRATLDGAAYGQPVVAGGRVFVATESDSVYALSPHDGSVLWRRSLGFPLQHVSSQAGCGDIDPLGITSTPVVDVQTSTVYVVGEVTGPGGVAPIHHQLVGFSFAGAQVLSINADPPLGSVGPSGERPIWLQQRAALALGNGRVYVAYGGLFGDCGLYHGWVVGLDEHGARPPVSFDATPHGQGGAIWGASGPAIGLVGNVYVTTGNPNNPQDPPVDYSNSVVKLDANLHPLSSFRDTHATGDGDLGTQGPMLLEGRYVFSVGKTDIGYLLGQPDLRPVSGSPIPNVCNGDPDGGSTYDPASNTVFVPCRGGGDLQAVNLTTRAAGPRFHGADGPPIFADGHVWSASGTSLDEIDPVNGSRTQTLSLNGATTTFSSPTAALGLIMVGTTTGVTAFAGPGGPPASPTSEGLGPFERFAAATRSLLAV